MFPGSSNSVGSVPRNATHSPHRLRWESAASFGNISPRSASSHPTVKLLGRKSPSSTAQDLQSIATGRRFSGRGASGRGFATGANSHRTLGSTPRYCKSLRTCSCCSTRDRHCTEQRMEWHSTPVSRARSMTLHSTAFGSIADFERESRSRAFSGLNSFGSAKPRTRPRLSSTPGWATLYSWGTEYLGIATAQSSHLAQSSHSLKLEHLSEAQMGTASGEIAAYASGKW